MNKVIEEKLIEKCGETRKNIEDFNDLMNRIREHCNRSRNQYELMKDLIKWYKLCSSMDLIEDTEVAIDSYSKLRAFNCWDGGYIYIYGLLQAMFLQQDAINNLSISLFNEKLSFDMDYPDLYKIREIRNSAIGHPTGRGKDKSFHFISRTTINNKGSIFAVNVDKS